MDDIFFVTYNGKNIPLFINYDPKEPEKSIASADFYELQYELTEQEIKTLVNDKIDDLNYQLQWLKTWNSFKYA